MNDILNKEEILKLNHLESFLLKDSHDSSVEIIRLYDKFVIFSIPMFGGDHIFEGQYERSKVDNMIKNHKLARNISDASWGLLMRMLEYKCKWYGRELIKIDTFFPSSKTCSSCGYKKEELKLSERTFSCESCGFEIDRDLNASINIKNEGLKISRLPVEDTDNSQANETGSKF